MPITLFKLINKSNQTIFSGYTTQEKAQAQWDVHKVDPDFDLFKEAGLFDDTNTSLPEDTIITAILQYEHGYEHV